MRSKWEYRIGAVLGVVVVTATAVMIANTSLVQGVATTYVPLVNRLPGTVLGGQELVVAIVLSTAIVVGSLFPLYKPRPQRILDTIFLTQKRVLTAVFAIATVGYFNWTYRIPRATLGVTAAILLVALPAWFVMIRRRPAEGDERIVIVGDDPDQIRRAADAVEGAVLGYLSPPIITGPREREPSAARADGGAIDLQAEGLVSLGGLSRLEQVLVNRDVDTVLLAFENPDRGEFFGVLETCHTHGVGAKVLREHADSVLLTITDGGIGELLTIDLEPWDWQERLVKRGFDIVFATVGLVVFAPFLALIAVAIKLDSSGPVFYGQDRTADLGSTFTVLKFRTMYVDSESAEPVDDEENDRITPVGRLLRESHLDELPQLWSILIGDMSVVGPRAVWTDEESLLEAQAGGWRKRWFVKPGLTGLAQVNDVSSTDPETKLQYDLEYIRRQSFWFDLKIVIRQIWNAFTDVLILLRGGDPNPDDESPEQ